MSKPRILLAVTGSIAAFKAAALASQLVQKGYTVQALLTEGAKRFVTDELFESLTGMPLLKDWGMAHIEGDRAADLILVYPASANAITRLSQGRADDLLGTVFLAHDLSRPFWIAPAMNPQMLAHPAVQEGLNRLSAWGVRVCEPAQGRMACGEEGQGRLIEPQEMLAQIDGHFAAPSSRLKILVTAGGTSEPIDAVRVVTNTSTGETGAGIAESLARAGHEVTLLLSRSATIPAPRHPQLSLERFGSFDELDRAIANAFTRTEFDLCIHAAAVSDFRPRAQTNKISSQKFLTLELEPLPKILDRIRGYARSPRFRLISFKLTADTSRDPDIGSYPSDLIVHNDVAGIARGTPEHSGTIYRKIDGSAQPIAQFKTKPELYRSLTHLVQGLEGHA